MCNSVSFEECESLVQIMNIFCEQIVHRLLHERNQRKLLEWKRLCEHMIGAVREKKNQFSVEIERVNAFEFVNHFDRFIDEQEGIVAVINDVYNT
jgi:hypothetical protein